MVIVLFFLLQWKVPISRSYAAYCCPLYSWLLVSVTRLGLLYRFSYVAVLAWLIGLSRAIFSASSGNKQLSNKTLVWE